MENRGSLDLVIAGPDMSGTSTQVSDVIKYFQNKGKIVRDIRGTEIDALFHTEVFQESISFLRNDFLNFGNFLRFIEEYKQVSALTVSGFLKYASDLMRGDGRNKDLLIASMVKNDVSSYINPNSADLWVMEEPSRRGAGQVSRNLELNRSSYGIQSNFVAAAEASSVYRSDELFRFRRPIREAGKHCLRSRSEESNCYEVGDDKFHPNGVDEDYYLNLAGHKAAFGNPPTHIFVVCGLDGWNASDYARLKAERSSGRVEDDYERDAPYQAMVNNRYAGDWLERIYDKACRMYGSEVPNINRFSIYDSKEDICEQMYSKLDEILKS